MSKPTDQSSDIIEPLEDLAWFTFRNAETLCDPDLGCVHYHRFWSMSRLLDLGGRLPRGRAFLIEAFRARCRPNRKTRILVAGSADTGVPVLVASAARQAKLDASIVVADRCRTPLAQNERLAAKTGLDLTTWCGSLADLDLHDFDFAVTHNVLGFGAPQVRRANLAAIARALRAGGRLLSVEFLTADRPPRTEKQIALMTQEFRERVNTTDLPAQAKADLLAAAQAHYRLQAHRFSYPEAEFLEDLRLAGLSLQDLTYRPDQDRASPRGHVSANKGRKYAYVVSERPG